MSKIGIVISLIALIGVIGGSVLYSDVIQDRKHKVFIKGSVDLYETHGETNNNKLGVLKPTDTVTDLRIRYGKDYQAIKVHTDAGLEGWIISGGSFELTQ